MVRIIGVRFRTAGKIYYFDPLQFEVKRGDHVIVETARGIEYGTVVGAPRDVEEDQIVSTLKPVLRVATERDVEQEANNKRKEKEAFKICLEKIKEHELDMKLIDAEYTFDNNKVLFYFTADGRIDFRDLVKDLASIFRTRIELRQIGVRDETKIRGGIGMCGRPLCCHSYLSDFIPVSIKMAKEQNLSLNPTKISGMCGRLMCCLKNEQETYEELNRMLPTVGDVVICPGALKGEVSGVNVLRQTVRVLVEDGDDKEMKEFAASDIHFHHHKNSKIEITEEELQAVRELEEKGDVESLEPEESAFKPERKERSYRERNRDYRANRSREAGENRDSRNREAGEAQDNRNREAGEKWDNRNREAGESRNNRNRNTGENYDNRSREAGESRDNRGRAAAESRGNKNREAYAGRDNKKRETPESREAGNKDRKSHYDHGANTDSDARNVRTDKTGKSYGGRENGQNTQANGSRDNGASGQTADNQSGALNGQNGGQNSQGNGQNNSQNNAQSGNANRRKNNYRYRKNHKADGNEKSNET